MGKRRKKNLADTVYAKKSVNKVNPFAITKPATAKHLNPFEVHVNKEKFRILGRTCKHDKGLPGISRSKASKKRKKTLGREFMERYKNNQFMDRRIGKHLNGDNLNDDILNARFVADQFEEFKLTKNKKSRFNLNDDEVLTHRGQTLEEIEHVHDDRSDDDDEDDQNNHLNAEFTEAANFGGTDDDKSVKDRKQAIEEMILEQKKRKMEIAKEKDAIFDLTEKLDTNYKNLINLMNNKSKKSSDVVKEKPPPDDYDKLMRELIFEPRGVVTDKLCNEETVRQKNEEHLKKLEDERFERMTHDHCNGTDHHAHENKENIKVQQKLKFRSADELDESYYTKITFTDEETLAYNDKGELNEVLAEDKRQNKVENTKAIGKDENEENIIEENNSNFVSEDENTDEDGYEQNNSNEIDDEGEDVDEQSNSDENEDEDEDEDDLSNLKFTDSDCDHTNDRDSGLFDTKELLIQRTVTHKSQNVKNKLPFIVVMPANYKEFKNLLDNYKLNDQMLIIERLFKCNQNDLKGKIMHNSNLQLFTYILRLLNAKFASNQLNDVRQEFDFLSKVMPSLYDLIHMDSKNVSNVFLKIIKQKYNTFNRNLIHYPSLDVLIIFKLISNLYSTSDFRHPLVTPCFIFMQHILSKSKIQTRKDIAKGLFLVTLCLEYTTLSKRLVPAVFNFILGVLSLSISQKSKEIMKIIPQPFPKHGEASELLVLEIINNKIDYSGDLSQQQQQKMLAEDLTCNIITEDFKVRCLNVCLKLAYDAAVELNDNIGTNFLAQPLLEILSCIPFTNYPDYVNENYKRVREILENWSCKTLIKLVAPMKKPKALRLLEPRIETVYDDKRRPKLSKDKQERLKLLHKVKRETKGAIREIRRDTEFLQKIRIQQQLQSDKERQEKVKRIYAEAAMQQGELNALDRAKKRRKF